MATQNTNEGVFRTAVAGNRFFITKPDEDISGMVVRKQENIQGEINRPGFYFSERIQFLRVGKV